MNWFRKPQRAHIRVIHSTSLTLAQWRASPELVAFARALLSDPKFQTLLDVLRSESPIHLGLSGGTHDDHIAHSYRGVGYQMCLNTLELLAATDAPRVVIEATFAPPEPL